MTCIVLEQDSDIVLRETIETKMVADVKNQVVNSFFLIIFSEIDIRISEFYDFIIRTEYEDFPTRVGLKDMVMKFCQDFKKE